jgi:thiol-disulfide isomerase/thioredoxin
MVRSSFVNNRAGLLSILKKQNNRTLKNYITFSNVSNLVVLLLLVTLIFSADAKGLLIEGLMKIGLFQPDIPKVAAESNVPASNKTSLTQDVEFIDSKGNTISLIDQNGKVVFINFWATWCPPCIAEMPTIDQLHEKYKDNGDIVFLMVDVDGKINESNTFMKDKGFRLSVHIPASELPKVLFAGSMPTTVILDKSGNIAFQHVGGADYSNPKISEFIDQLLKQ